MSPYLCKAIYLSPDKLFLRFHRLTTAVKRSIASAGDDELCPAFFTNISLSNLIRHLCSHLLIFFGICNTLAICKLPTHGPPVRDTEKVLEWNLLLDHLDGRKSIAASCSIYSFQYYKI